MTDQILFALGGDHGSFHILDHNRNPQLNGQYKNAQLAFALRYHPRTSVPVADVTRSQDWDKMLTDISNHKYNAMKQELEEHGDTDFVIVWHDKDTNKYHNVGSNGPLYNHIRRGLTRVDALVLTDDNLIVLPH